MNVFTGPFFFFLCATHFGDHFRKRSREDRFEMLMLLIVFCLFPDPRHSSFSTGLGETSIERLQNRCFSRRPKDHVSSRSVFVINFDIRNKLENSGDGNLNSPGHGKPCFFCCFRPMENGNQLSRMAPVQIH